MALLTSGGDSPGMNACIRAVVLSAAEKKIRVNAYYRGYEGLIDNRFSELGVDQVRDIVHRGGTILKTARSARFMELRYRKQAAEHLRREGVEGMIIIGGDGSFRGAIALNEEIDIPIVGCAGTIDNDLVGTDFTIGYDTAINTATEAIDRIRDTAQSHDRIFVVEVMGRDAGLIALRTAIAAGADAVLIPELRHDLQDLKAKLLLWAGAPGSRIVVVAEGDENGGAYKIAELIKAELPKAEVRVSILGHIQRGGNPSAMERVNAGTIGYHAVQALLLGHKQVMVGLVNRKVHYTPFREAVKHHQRIRPELEELIRVLSST